MIKEDDLYGKVQFLASPIVRSFHTARRINVRAVVLELEFEVSDGKSNS